MEINYEEKLNEIIELMKERDYEPVAQLTGYLDENQEDYITRHGTASKFSCGACGREDDNIEILEIIKRGQVPKCKHCAGLMKPKVVLYEEPLYEGVAESAVDYISQADMLIVGGTSLAVYPAASFVRYFKGKHLVMINKSETGYDTNADIIIRENIGEVFEMVMNTMGK